jgi:hypothetical protein
MPNVPSPHWPTLVIVVVIVVILLGIHWVAHKH